jgi:hypothetical protein
VTDNTAFLDRRRRTAGAKEVFFSARFIDAGSPARLGIHQSLLQTGLTHSTLRVTVHSHARAALDPNQ